MRSFGEGEGVKHTDSAREHLLVVDVGLTPCHEVLDVLWRGHLGWSLEVLGVLPEVLEPA